MKSEFSGLDPSSVCPWCTLTPTSAMGTGSVYSTPVTEEDPITCVSAPT